MSRVAGVVLLMCSAAMAEPFVYQGQLKESGELANGEYDFRFELYNAETGGTQLGATNAFGNLEVVDGVFEVDLDFGDMAFDGSERWLRILVRPGANVGSYTPLLPRTRVSKAPQAQIADEALFADHAITAETLINPQWTDAPGILWYGDGNDRVLINHNATIDSTSYFGVHANTSGDVGMTVSGLAGSDPYYAYGANGVISAKTEFDSSSETWRLENAGNLAISVNGDGESSFYRAVTAWLGLSAPSYQFTTPKAGVISLPAQVFHSQSGEPLRFWHGVAFEVAGGGILYANAQLPHGATVTRMTAYCEDEVTGSLRVTLYRKTLSSTGRWDMGEVSTTGYSGEHITLTDSTIDVAVIDNHQYGYYVEIASADWPGWVLPMSVYGVKIEYTVDEAD